jgi:sugar transferase (PEP-CTERM system associated)
MSISGILKRHWLHVSMHFALDWLLFCFAFILGTHLRFDHADSIKMFWAYLPAIPFGALVFSCITYIFGLYSPQSANRGLVRRSLILAGAIILAVILMVGINYVNFSTRIGRGVMLISLIIAYATIWAHHSLLRHWLKSFRERVAFVITSASDEMEARLFQTFGKQNLDLAGLIHTDGYHPTGENKVLGPVSQLSEIVQSGNISRIFCTNKSMRDPALCKKFCELRYSGVTVMPLISLFEEVHQVVPLALITPEWLLGASDLPHVIYIRKLKRGFDIIASLAGLIFLQPLLIAGMLAVKLTSPGPIFYRQVRCGRFGKPFNMIKLRTMAVDAEKHGAVWAAKKDPRATPVGNFLRKYRIDELPQLINILRGEMSLVGPRPERPEFIDQLAKTIPFYQERLMVQPGLTGWAQVNYPYGASLEDARRKLEYDLYYMKHMSLFLDLFNLLDTVRIILRGGLNETHKKKLPHYETVSDIGDTTLSKAVDPPMVPAS